MKKLFALMVTVFVFSAQSFALNGVFTDVQDGKTKRWAISVQNEFSLEKAHQLCQNLNLRLPTVPELEQIYTTTKASGQSLLAGNRNGYMVIWSSESNWTVDALPVLPPLLVIPFPEKAGVGLTIYSDSYGAETKFANAHRHILEGGKAYVLCIGE